MHADGYMALAGIALLCLRPGQRQRDGTVLGALQDQQLVRAGGLRPSGRLDPGPCG